MIEMFVGIIQLALVIALAPLVSGFARWMRAKMHTRQGASVLQDYYDIAKLFKRTDLHTKESGFIHRIMPVLFLATVAVLTLGIPMITLASPVPALGDMILVIYLLALPRFFFALSSVDSGSSYAGVGGIRELIVGVLVEPTLILALFVTVLLTGSSNIGGMGEAIASLSIDRPIAVCVAGVAFAAACYIELGKLPFDAAEAEQELQEGPLSEYSGPSLATIKLAMSAKQIVVISWFLAIFLPFGAAAELTLSALAVGLVVFVVKLAVLLCVCCVFENVVSRVRFKLLGRQTWTVFGIAVFALVFCLFGI
jgi:hydrogenase-4 component C